MIMATKCMYDCGPVRDVCMATPSMRENKPRIRVAPPTPKEREHRSSEATEDVSSPQRAPQTRIHGFRNKKAVDTRNEMCV